MIHILQNFKGEFSEDSVGATVYSYFQYFFYQSLFTEQTVNGRRESKLMSKDPATEKDEKFWNEKRQLLLIDNYMFSNTYQALISKMATYPY